MQNDKFNDYFMPNEVVYFVEHDRLLRSEAVIGQLRELDLVNKDEFLKTVQPSPERLQTFNLEGKAVSLAFARIAGAVEPKTPEEASKYAASLVDQLYRLWPQVQKSPATKNGFKLQAVAPNWMAGGTQGQVITGGPGAQPTPPKPPVPPNWQGQPVDAPGAPWGFRSKVSGIPPKPGNAHDVQVFILDTAPVPKDFEAALTRLPGNSILKSLLAPRGKLAGSCLSIVPLPGSLMRTLIIPGASIHSHFRGHDYLMADHGTFVAGIIHTLAPKANLTVIQVLNDYGVGNLATLAWGFGKIWELLGEKRSSCLIVNCSLTLATPLGDKRVDEVVWHTDLRKDFGAFLQYLCSPLETLCLAVDQAGGAVVAAAGNDGVKYSLPQARYPAACDHATGIGAMQDLSHLAEYSNKSDRPEPVGLYTFGGKTNHAQANASTGMLGLYIGHFPGKSPEEPGPQSEDGWARWAGTSFSTPVIAGMVAAQCSGTGTPPDALSDLTGRAEVHGPQKWLPIEQG